MTQLLREAGHVTVSATEETVHAGQSLEVTVRLVADGPLEVVSAEVELVRNLTLFRVERSWTGAGFTVNRYATAVLATAPLSIAGPLDAGQQQFRRARLIVPTGEATISGRLIQQDYEVRALIHLGDGRDAEECGPVRVTSPAAAWEWVADAAPVRDDAGIAVLGFERLDNRQLRDGVPLSGAVTVNPLEHGMARGLRVELVREERVPGHDDDEAGISPVVVAAAYVEDHIDLEPGSVLRRPFTLGVPMPLPAPSISTPEFTVRWLLQAVLDRPLRPDPVTTLELCAVTG
jgi:hypothetical protein